MAKNEERFPFHPACLTETNKKLKSENLKFLEEKKNIHIYIHKTARNPNSNPNVNQGLLTSHFGEKEKIKIAYLQRDKEKNYMRLFFRDHTSKRRIELNIYSVKRILFVQKLKLS